jgi:hypothetical protein
MEVPGDVQSGAVKWVFVRSTAGHRGDDMLNIDMATLSKLVTDSVADKEIREAT